MAFWIALNSIKFDFNLLTNYHKTIVQTNFPNKLHRLSRIYCIISSVVAFSRPCIKMFYHRLCNLSKNIYTESKDGNIYNNSLRL